MVVRLSQPYAPAALYPPRKIPGTHFCYRLSRPQGHSAVGRIRWIEKSNDIGNRTRDLQACSIVPQPATLPRAPMYTVYTACFKTNTAFYPQSICVFHMVLTINSDWWVSVSQSQQNHSPVEGEWPLVVRPLLSSKRRPHFKTLQVLERT
jgi:hypothetical protein